MEAPDIAETYDIDEGLISRTLELRRWLHRNPELSGEEYQTTSLIADTLRRLGYEVQLAAGTGVVAVLRRGIGRTLGIRADIDALPIVEANQLPHQSQIAGRMHACGHDGHMAILLGAAEWLASATFSGTLVLIFQPAEEIATGAKTMLDAGMLDDFDFDAFVGLHNWPSLPVGQIALHKTASMASADRFTIRLKGTPYHPAMLDRARSTLGAASSIVLKIQEDFARTTDEGIVISVSEFEADGQRSLTPSTVDLAGTVRALTVAGRESALAYLKDMTNDVCDRYRIASDLTISRACPACINSPELEGLVRKAAVKAAGIDNVRDDIPPTMGADDFGYFAQRWPCSYIWLGNGNPDRSLHSASYDFNDDAIPVGVGLWVAIAELVLGAILPN
ncbi:amidohydrolase [Rhizobium leguminosarum bv. trifolii WSM597]|uniref:Amidohydrolase n=1 Tax=Rhizobium leguminosarum bv. trifolii WSM597 TaxID=754764 RepID=I9NGG7_RHILT|nr:amidohydrolase [Rhizobium leguminosarum]EJB07044.1 amidohydrolase [Rhizobium leguminosarum bv. trifolii WSM597]